MTRLAMITVAAFLMLLSLAPSQSFRRKPKETSTAEAAPLSVSVCVPAIVADFHSNLPDLLASVAMQTVMPLEIIIVATGVPQDRCQTLRDELEAMSKIVLLTCLPELQNQATARNMAAAKAKGTFISFIDADDAMYPERTAVILDVARQHPQLQLILHTFSTESLLNHHGADIPLDETLVRHGDYLFDLARSKEGTGQLRLNDEIMHSQCTVSASIMQALQFRTEKMYYRDEDSKFVRDAVYLIGRKREEMLFVTVPLGRYKKRPKSHTGVYLCSGVAAVAMWAVYYWLGCDWAHISGYCHDSVESVCIRPIK